MIANPIGYPIDHPTSPRYRVRIARPVPPRTVPMDPQVCMHRHLVSSSSTASMHATKSAGI